MAHHAPVADDGGHPIIEHPSYELPGGRALPTLPNPRKDLPCVQRPRDYDEDQPPRVRIAAARRCRRECPQLDACTALLASLGPDVARGVMAGEVDVRRRWLEDLALLGLIDRAKAGEARQRAMDSQPVGRRAHDLA